MSYCYSQKESQDAHRVACTRLDGETSISSDGAVTQKIPRATSTVRPPTGRPVLKQTVSRLRKVLNVNDKARSGRPLAWIKLNLVDSALKSTSARKATREAVASRSSVDAVVLRFYPVQRDS